MIWQSASSRRKQIVIDISTQRDFFLAEGKACIRNHRRVLANIRRIMAWARHKNLSVISTCQIYPGNNGGSAIDYCIDGTEGQKKISYTLLKSRIAGASHLKTVGICNCKLCRGNSPKAFLRLGTRN